MKINELKHDLAAAFRWTARLNMNEGVGNHFSAWVPGSSREFYVNKAGIHFSQIKASDLILVTNDLRNKEKELNIIAEETIKKYHIHDLFCKHRIGKVFVGEVSLHVVIWSKHRKEGLDAMTYFISELKRKVPIWKWAIHKDGTKVPSDCTHQ